jgi:hypothetical protein
LDPTVEDNPLTHSSSKEEEDIDENDESEDDSGSEESNSEESESALEDGENETVNDKLRMAVREALGSAAPLTDTVP